jgi:poly(A) polymerase
MLFARVEYAQIGPDFDNLLDNNILRNVDEETIKSLNGCRVTDMILNFVPNKPNFELTLRCIKLWAKHRGVYSNMLGYLGGVNWAILVAKVCMDNSDAAPNQLIHKFFTFYRDFDWVNNPIALDGILNDPEIVQFKLPDKTLEHLWQ